MSAFVDKLFDQGRNSPKKIEGANKKCRPPWLGDEENFEKSSLSNGLWGIFQLGLLAS